MEQKKKKIFGRGALYTLFSFTFLMLLLLVWQLFLSGELQAEEVISASMEPTLMVGDRLLVERYTPQPLERGTILVIKPQDEGDNPLVKRLIGLPGDTIYMRNGDFYINGRIEDWPEQMPSHSANEWMPAVDLQEDWYFVLGDNRPDSFDSEEFGPIPEEDILGIVKYRYSPWARRGWLN